MKNTNIKLDLSKYNSNSKAVTVMIKLSKEHTEFLNQILSKSGKIRFLNDLGYNRSSIAKFLEIKYQFVRNVLENDKMKNELNK